MKPAFLSLMLLFATAAAVYLHRIKTRASPPDGQAYEYALAPLQIMLQSGQGISLRNVNMPGEAFMYIRLALAPRHVELFNSEKPADTVLLATSGNAIDSSLAQRLVLWQSKAGNFTFKLLR